jgi:hypothetical protein
MGCFFSETEKLARGYCLTYISAHQIGGQKNVYVHLLVWRLVLGGLGLRQPEQKFRDARAQKHSQDHH